MKLVKRKPGVGYFDSHLWLPKSHVSEMQLAGSLQYDRGEYDAPIRAWREERHHFVVPRNYLPPGGIRVLPFPVFDSRIRSYPRVSIKSKVTLDYLDPSSTMQRDASAALLQTHDGILCLRCGAGKTAVSIHSAAQLQVPVLAMVDNKQLLKQWEDEVLELTNLKKGDIGIVGDGSFDWKKPFTIGTVQTLARLASEGRIPPEMVRWFGVLLLDEAHLLGAPWFNMAVPPFQGRRWALSATPRRLDMYDSLLRYTVGEVVYKYLTPELIPKVFFRKLPTVVDRTDPVVAEAVNDKTGEQHLQKTYGYISSLDSRTDLIVRDIKSALKEGRQVLVLSQSRKMVELLGSRLPGAGVCHGGILDRTERMRRIRDCNPIVCIAQIGKQALNKPALDTLFVTEPFSNINVLQQIMGRILRLKKGKQNPIVVFFEDTNITPLRKLCNKMRGLLTRWPTEMGGRISYTNVDVTLVQATSKKQGVKKK